VSLVAGRDVLAFDIGAWQRPQQALSAGSPLSDRAKGTDAMIVFGADMHKLSHTIAAVGPEGRVKW
jgi:hypothetical protein